MIIKKLKVKKILFLLVIFSNIIYGQDDISLSPLIPIPPSDLNDQSYSSTEKSLWRKGIENTECGINFLTDLGPDADLFFDHKNLDGLIKEINETDRQFQNLQRQANNISS